MGQRRGVHVYKFKCKGTIEEALEDILESKSQTMAQLIDKLAEPNTPAEQLEPIVSALSSALATKL
jgi:SNF2 family DNA or RNA helicase